MFAACWLSSCQNQTVLSQRQQVSVTIPVCPSKQEVVLRSTDENSITDVNVFLVQEQDIVFHKYYPSETVQFEYPAGHYRLFVIANHHTDLGDLDIEELRAYTLHYKQEYKDLPMTAVSDIEIVTSNDVQVLPPVEVSRSVAKINYKIVVESPMQNIILQSVQVISLPQTFRPFDDTGAGTSERFENAEIIQNDDRVSMMAGSFYMLPNPQGTVADITKQEDKNPRTAPAHATYLRIRATAGSKVLDYIVYLGENETSDFNIRPNTAHTLNITILNDNEADIRISSYTIDVTCEIQAEPQDGVYLNTAPIIFSAILTGNTKDAGLYCEFKLKSGNLNVYNVNGISASVVRLPLNYLHGLNSFTISYTPTNFSHENCILQFCVNIYDRFGLVRSYDFTYRFTGKIVKVYTKWFDGGNGTGTLSSPDALTWIRKMTLSSIYYLFYCPDEGCTIIPSPLAKFQGFYRTHDLNEYLGADEYFHYQPTSTDDTIYAYFY